MTSNRANQGSARHDGRGSDPVAARNRIGSRNASHESDDSYFSREAALQANPDLEGLTRGGRMSISWLYLNQTAGKEACHLAFFFIIKIARKRVSPLFAYPRPRYSIALTSRAQGKGPGALVGVRFASPSASVPRPHHCRRHRLPRSFPGDGSSAKGCWNWRWRNRSDPHRANHGGIPGSPRQTSAALEDSSVTSEGQEVD